VLVIRDLAHEWTLVILNQKRGVSETTADDVVQMSKPYILITRLIGYFKIFYSLGSFDSSENYFISAPSECPFSLGIDQ
jgi:hypothetical protein